MSDGWMDWIGLGYPIPLWHQEHRSRAMLIIIPMCFGFIRERFIILHVPKILRLDFSFGLWSQSLERESRGTKGSMEVEHYTNLKHLELLHSTRIHLTCQCKDILFNGFNGWSVGNKIRLVNSLIRIEWWHNKKR